MPEDKPASRLSAIGPWFTAVKKMSPWLMIWIFVEFFAYIGLLILVWRYIHGTGTFGEILYAMGTDRSRSWFEIEMLAGVPFSVALIWFAFLSKSKLVTENDRKCVIIMFLGAAIGLINFALHYSRLH